ncbi:unnamed protein product [Eruca vesicaria subsp. sativa]|uniref:C2 domain-containing protein n=1 Tax=Eruca vesicaria subsp. sativa TaxID=29727 RepID=A0ABC8KML1_ERUVS|nr:unnamed protein product [Eruca vesicaria subsp. sativa]
MANLTLELNIYSAKDLENVNLITKMDVYAVVSIDGDDSQKNHKEKTPVDRTGGSEHTWNHAVKFSVDQRLAWEGRLTLVVKLVCDRMFGGKDLGEVQVPILELLNTSPSFNGDGGNGNVQGMRFVTYQVRTPCRKGQGSLTFSYRFDMPSFKPDPVQSNPVDISPPASYPPATEPGLYPPLSSIGYPPSSQPQGYPAPPFPHPYTSHYPEQPVNAYPPSPSASHYPPSSSASNLYPPPSHGAPPQNHYNVYPPPSYGVSPPQHSNVYPPPPDKPVHSYQQMQPSHSFHGYAPPPPPDKPGHSYHQTQPSQSFHGYAQPVHTLHQMRPSQSFHGYAPSPQTQHGYGYPPPGYGRGHPPTQTPQKNNKPGVGLGMGAGLLGGALGGLLLGDLVSDIGF